MYCCIYVQYSINGNDAFDCRALFCGENDFSLCLKESFPELKTRMLTRLQWCKIRRLMGKPRRYSCCCCCCCGHSHRVTTPGKSWNLLKPFSRPGKSWKTAKVMKSHEKSWKVLGNNDMKNAETPKFIALPKLK